MTGPAPSKTFRPRLIRCPACGSESRYSSGNPSRPFCSERCRGLDFGDWAAENYRLPAKPASEDGDPADSTNEPI